MRFTVSALAAVVLLHSPADARQPRASSARAEFQRSTPCPANGLRRGPCPGWVVDHVTPLCAGGQDHHSNMQWQSVSEAKAKDREERAMCRAQPRS